MKNKDRNKDSWGLGEDIGLTPDTPLSVLTGLPPYTTSEDKKGHEVFLGAKFPKIFTYWATKLKESSGGHYGVTADVVRDAIYIGFSVIDLRLKEQGWEVERLIAGQEAKIFEKARIYKRMEVVVDNLATLLDYHDEEAAKESLNSYIASIDEEKSHLRDKYMSALRQKLLERHLGSLMDEVNDK